MKLFVTVALPPGSKTHIQTLEAAARDDRIGIHALCKNPAEADIILFVDGHHHHSDWKLNAIRRHPLALKYRHKTMIYDERDRPWCGLPGVYISMPARDFDAKRQRAYGYLDARHDFKQPLGGKPDLLYSFVGAQSHPIREHILKLHHPRGVAEASGVSFFDFSGADEIVRRQEAQKMRYRELLERSKFVLCPRGMGVSSFRLFEVMASGRVPVIISDEWVAPPGPDWNAFSIRVSENQIAQIPRILEAAESRFDAMAPLARQAYDEWFAPDVVFHQLIERLSSLLKNGRVPRPDSRPWLKRQYWHCAFNHVLSKIKPPLGRLKRRLLKRN